MSNISQFFAGTRKKNRRIIHGSVGVTTVTWLVPPGVTEVEVHCWGAGGNGSGPSPGTSGGGGGGGYVTHVYPVVFGDRLQITAGAAPGGTSSVSVPTQSPGSPISATGGSVGLSTIGGSGGAGSYTIAPGISTARTFSASGGSGGGAATPGGPSPGSRGGGGAAGSPFGTGGAGGSAPTSPLQNCGGGGIGGPGNTLSGGGSLGAAISSDGGAGKNGYKTAVHLATPVTATLTDNAGGSAGGDDWFYVDEILGAGGTPLISHAGAGGGGGGTAGNGGILGGGSGGTGAGGLAGGGGGSTGAGGAGLVILYW